MFEWTQTLKNITIKFPIPYKIDSKKFESQITDSFLKLNILDPKLFRFIDFYEEIEFLSTKIIIEDKNIVFFISKKFEGTWPQLESKLSKEELILRRKLSEENFIKEVENQREKAKETKKDLEKFVFNKSIKLDEEKRKELKDKKQEEKSNIENDLYNFVSNYDQKNAIDNSLHLNTEKLTDKQKNITDNIKEISKKETKFKNNEINDNNKHKNKIFDEENIIENNSKIRSESKINVNLTEKEIPHFAARESLSKDPPYPKSKKFVIEKNHVK